MSRLARGLGQALGLIVAMQNQSQANNNRDIQPYEESYPEVYDDESYYLDDVDYSDPNLEVSMEVDDDGRWIRTYRYPASSFQDGVNQIPKRVKISNDAVDVRIERMTYKRSYDRLDW